MPVSRLDPKYSSHRLVDVEYHTSIVPLPVSLGA